MIPYTPLSVIEKRIKDATKAVILKNHMCYPEEETKEDENLYLTENEPEPPKPPEEQGITELDSEEEKAVCPHCGNSHDSEECPPPEQHNQPPEDKDELTATNIEEDKANPETWHPFGNPNAKPGPNFRPYGNQNIDGQGHDQTQESTQQEAPQRASSGISYNDLNTIATQFQATDPVTDAKVAAIFAKANVGEAITAVYNGEFWSMRVDEKIFDNNGKVIGAKVTGGKFNSSADYSSIDQTTSSWTIAPGQNTNGLSMLRGKVGAATGGSVFPNNSHIADQILGTDSSKQWPPSEDWEKNGYQNQLTNPQGSPAAQTPQPPNRPPEKPKPPSKPPKPAKPKPPKPTKPTKPKPAKKSINQITGDQDPEHDE